MTIHTALALSLALAIPGTPQAARPDTIRPVPFTAVHLNDQFWAPRLQANREVTLAHVLDECEATGRIANLEVAAGTKPGGMVGYCFNDTDVYKTLEGAAYILQSSPDPEVQARCDEIIAKIAAAQEPDGYLYTPRTILDPKNMPPGGPERWSDMAMGHELYCAGHLYEAAVAYFHATGKRALLDIAIKNADLLAATFGRGKNPHPPGHPEIELGLARLYEHTGDTKYLDLLRFFVDARGRAEGGRHLYGEYSQDAVPVLDQTHAVGHAVRLGYLFAGTTDLARLTGETAYLDASKRVWDDVVTTKLYLTGGMGSQGNNEGFGAPFDLPNSSAYNETCSSISMVLWSHRLNLATGDARYADVMERTLYNALLAGWSLSGDKFFYPNPLASATGAERQPWFGCACCPPNVLRFFASMPGLMYAVSDDALLVNLYAAGDADLTVAGTPVAIAQETDYPWDGAIKVRLTPDRPTRFALRLRVPGWATGQVTPGDLYHFADTSDEQPTLTVNGEAVALQLDHGYAVLEREWTAGDRVELALPMPARRVVADERVAADRDRAALVRGPLVYCFEDADHPDGSVLGFVTPIGDRWLPFDAERGPLGVPLIGRAEAIGRDANGSPRVLGPTPARAIPYYAWANRTRGAMCVWTATTPAAAKPAPYPTIARQATASSSFGGELAALADQMEPSSSGDHDNPFLHWWPRKGTEEWVQYDFAQPTRVAGVEVYWFDDTGRGECRLPGAWRLLALVEGDWTEVTNPSAYATDADRMNRCTFDEVEAAGLRLVVQSPEGWAGGIHEWRVLGSEELPPPVQPEDDPQAQAPNLLPNASFEEIDADAPVRWTRSVWGGKPTLTAENNDPHDAHHGKNSVTIRSDTGADAAWSCTVPVEPNSRYRLSGWITTRDVETQGGAHGALLNIHNIPDARTQPVVGSHDWTPVAVEFDTELNDSVMVNCLFGGWGLATGSAAFDQIALTLISRGEAEQPRISIDATKAGEPISKYIYGQFIEHLGRCIYGGIWAEMLQDRKFFYPVNDTESPWRSTSPVPGGLTMDTQSPFVGEHAVRIQPQGHGATAPSLTQGGLGLVEGHEYRGYVWLAGEGDLQDVTASLSWGDDPAQSQVVHLGRVRPEFTRTDFRFVAGATTDDAALTFTPQGDGVLRIGTASLMPADNIQGFRSDTLALLKRLDSPVYRWPGGNFVSGYDWRDGIGDRDRRPPRKNPAWTGVEHNDVGIHEFMALCDLLGTEPYIAINTGLGSTQDAVDELAYLNSPADTPMGRLRAAHGRAEPWGVRFIGIGNEMYGDWQLGNVPLEEYTQRHNAFVDALRAVDPAIIPIGVGAVGDWSRTMLRDCADRMDYMSEHVYWQDRPGLLSHVMQAPRSLRATADAHRRYRQELDSLRGRDIRICEDEWNYWYGPHVFGELGTRYFMKDALGCAAALHEFGRNSDIYFMANYAQTVNVIGAIKTSRTNAAMETTGLVLELYRKRLGVIPCLTESTPTLDALAAWTLDRSQLTIGIVNASTRPAEIALDLKGAVLTGGGTRWEIAADDPDAYNDPDAGQPIQTRESPVRDLGDTLVVPPCSVTLLSLDVR